MNTLKINLADYDNDVAKTQQALFTKMKEFAEKSWGEVTDTTPNEFHYAKAQLFDADENIIRNQGFRVWLGKNSDSGTFFEIVPLDQG